MACKLSGERTQARDSGGANMSELGQLVRNAVAAEQAAAAFYRSLAKDTRAKDAFAFLTDLAEQEDEHAREIEGFGRDLIAGALPVDPNMDVDTIETAPAWRYAVDLSLDQALGVALEAETSAALYYDAVADSLTGEAETFFRDLSKTELDHARQLRERIKG
jgi:rubrerythrin